MAIAAQRNSKTLPIIIAVIAVLVILGLGYFVYTTLTDNKNEATPSGTSLDTSSLEGQRLQYVQYVAGEAPVPSSAEVGREDPYAPY